MPYAKAGAKYRIKHGGEEYITMDVIGNEFFEQDTLYKGVIENNPEWFKKEEENHDFDLLVEQERIFNIAREVAGTPVGKIQYSDGDWGVKYEYKYRTFLDYVKATKS